MGNVKLKEKNPEIDSKTKTESIKKASNEQLRVALYDIALLVLIPYNFIILSATAFLILTISAYWILIVLGFSLMLGWLSSRLISKIGVDTKLYANVGAVDIALILPISLFLFLELLPKLSISWLSFDSGINAIYPTVLYYLGFNAPFLVELVRKKEKRNFALSYVLGVLVLVCGIVIVSFLVNKII